MKTPKVLMHGLHTPTGQTPCIFTARAMISGNKAQKKAAFGERFVKVVSGQTIDLFAG